VRGYLQIFYNLVVAGTGRRGDFVMEKEMQRVA